MTDGLTQIPAGRATWLSPYGLALVSFTFFVLVWMLPPSLYTAYLEERDLLFLDPASMLLYALCVGAFILGLSVVATFFPAVFAPLTRIKTRLPATAFLLLPIAVASAFTLASIGLLLQGNPALVGLILLQQGSQIKDTLDVRQPLGLSSMWLLGICWWAMWRYRQVELRSRWSRWAISLSIAAGILLVLISALLKLARGELIPVVAGCALLYLVQRTSEGRWSTRTALKAAIVLSVGVIALFTLMSLARGSEDMDAFVSALLGYTVSSYNRLAALVNGRLHYPYTGSGLYLSSFVSFNTSLNSVLPISDFMHWPSYADMWDSQFAATWQAGLDGTRIWSGAFGYIFADFGWLSPLVLFIYGLLCGWVWRSIKLGHLSGIILYPWCGFCILFWFGTNALLDTKLVVFLLVALVLSGYEHLLVRTVSPVAG
ncbi:MAG: hypothetical protein ABR902_03635 [Candidatus Korobacteraceae bacterium]